MSLSSQVKARDRHRRPP